MFREIKIDITRAQKEDYDEVIKVMNICMPKPEKPEVLRQALSLSRTFVARVDEKIVGTTSYSKSELRDGKIVNTPLYRRDKMCYMWGIAVLPEYRRQRIAEQLVREAERDMYRNHEKGYIVNAVSEEVAQYYVRTFGARIIRLALRLLLVPGIPMEKKFRQEGILEDLKKKLRQIVSLLLKKTYTRIKATLTESLRNR